MWKTLNFFFPISRGNLRFQHFPQGWLITGSKHSMSKYIKRIRLQALLVSCLAEYRYLKNNYTDYKIYFPPTNKEIQNKSYHYPLNYLCPFAITASLHRLEKVNTIFSCIVVQPTTSSQRQGWWHMDWTPATLPPPTGVSKVVAWKQSGTKRTLNTRKTKQDSTD